MSTLVAANCWRDRNSLIRTQAEIAAAQDMPFCVRYGLVDCRVMALIVEAAIN